MEFVTKYEDYNDQEEKANRITGNETGSIAGHVTSNDIIYGNLLKNVSL